MTSHKGIKLHRAPKHVILVVWALKRVSIQILTYSACWLLMSECQVGNFFRFGFALWVAFISKICKAYRADAHSVLRVVISSPWKGWPLKNICAGLKCLSKTLEEHDYLTLPRMYLKIIIFSYPICCRMST